MDKQVHKNRLELKFAIFFLPYFPLPMPSVPFFPVEGFSPKHIIRNARDRAKSYVAEKVAPLAQFAEEFVEAYEEYIIYRELSSTLENVSERVRKDQKTSKALDKLETQLKNGNFKGGRKAKKLPGTKTIFYLRSGEEARLFFQYSGEEKGVIKIIGESDKDNETRVIKNIKKNYK